MGRRDHDRDRRQQRQGQRCRDLRAHRQRRCRAGEPRCLGGRIEEEEDRGDEKRGNEEIVLCSRCLQDDDWERGEDEASEDRLPGRKADPSGEANHPHRGHQIRHGLNEPHESISGPQDHREQGADLAVRWVRLDVGGARAKRVTDCVTLPP